MKRFVSVVTISLILGLGLVLALLRLFNQLSPAYADTGIRYVSLDGVDENDCSSVETRCQTVQRAVDVAAAGDVIKIASGTYSDVWERPSDSGYNGSALISQVVYISTNVTIRGGYAVINGYADPPTSVSRLAPQEQGRGMYIAPGVTVTLERLQLENGSAAGFGGGGSPTYLDAGGGLYADRATVIISDCLFVQNIAASAGGIYVNSGSFILQESVITANIAITSNAGGLYIHSPSITTINHNSVLSNTAIANGGGLYLAYGQSDSILSDNSFVGNKAAAGGGIYMNSEATLINNQVMSNSASYRGGGLYANSRSPLIEANHFIGNYGGDGGGLWLRRSEGLFKNNIVAQNQVESGDLGAGIYIGGGTPNLFHTTLAQNTGGDGSGVYISDDSGMYGNATLTNTILVSHTTGLYVENGNTAMINGVLWYGNSVANTAGSGTIIVNHAYTGSPAFVNSDDWDYHISAISMARNNGVSAGVEDDIDGDPRLGIPDIGADEIIWNTYLPVILR